MATRQIRPLWHSCCTRTHVRWRTKPALGFFWITSWWDHPWTPMSPCKGNRIENCWHHLRDALKGETENMERWMFLASRESCWGKELNKSLRCLFSHPERSPDPRLKGNTTSQGWPHHAWVLATRRHCTTTSIPFLKDPPQHRKSSPLLPLEPFKPLQSATSWLY